MSTLPQNQPGNPVADIKAKTRPRRRKRRRRSHYKKWFFPALFLIFLLSYALRDQEPEDLQTGWISTDQGKYYLNENGLMHTGWLVTETGRYYMGENGLAVTGWNTVDGQLHHFSDDGRLSVGWTNTEKGKYYFTTDGTIATGWVDTDEGHYFLNEDGSAYCGWMNTGTARYYFTADGKMAVGFWEVDGIQRYFSSDGNYVPLLNPWNTMPKDYEPDLVELWGYQVDSACKDPLEALVLACREAGHICELNSTYRGINTQQYLWDNRYNTYKADGYSDDEAYRLTARRVAYPGTSEHHTGLAVDITGTEEMYAWFREHSWEYGFIVRYPRDKEAQTGIMYEPWHLRYVGTELAKAVYDSGLCLEEYFEFLKQ